MQVTTDYDRIEQMVVKQLNDYNTITSRIKILKKQPAGNGVYIDVKEGEDKLYALHKALKDMPSHMYLSQREQRIETAANAYLTQHPNGTRDKLFAVRSLSVLDKDDQKLLHQLETSIENVIRARHGNLNGYDDVVERISVIQDLERKKEAIDNVLDEMEKYKPNWAKLIRLRYIEDRTTEEVSTELNIHRDTYNTWRRKAINEYAQLAGIE